MLADDLTLILKVLLSIENPRKLFNKFSQCSELKINIDITKAKYRKLIHTRPLSTWPFLD